MILDLEKYQKLLNLGRDIKFIKIDHEDTIVAQVYKIERPAKDPLILKICPSFDHYRSEVYFLKYFLQKIPVPNIISSVEPTKENHGVVLMEYLTGQLLNPELITKDLAFEIGQCLATIHANKAPEFGYINKKLIMGKSTRYFKEKFLEGIDESKNHLSEALIDKCYNYFNTLEYLIEKGDGPCIVHRDFRPGNIIVENNQLKGIIDWSSARFGFSEEDFCSAQYTEWKNFNGYKKYFMEGYSNIRRIPNYSPLMPLLQLSRAIAIVGFTIKRGTWNTSNSKLYQSKKNFIKNFFQEKA